MKSLNTLIWILLSTSLIAGNQPDKDGELQRLVTKSIPVKETTSISVSNRFGDVKVKTWSESKVDFTATIKASSSRKSDAEVKSFLDQIQIEVEDKGSELRITTIYPDEKMNNISISVDYSINIPSKNDFDLENEFGNADLIGIGGKLDANVSHGNLTVADCINENSLFNRFGNVLAKNIGAPSKIDASNGNVKVEKVSGKLNIKDKFGSISVKEIKGDLMINSGNGDVRISDVSETAIINNSFGSIDVNNVRKELTIESQNGDVEAITFGGGTINNSFGKVVAESVKGTLGLTVRNQNGDIKLKGIQGNVEIKNSFASSRLTDIGGDLKVRAQNCSVEVHHVSGKTDIENSFGMVEVTQSESDVVISNQNGDVIVDEVKKTGKKYDLSSSFGSVKLYVPSSISATVYGETSFGEIESDFDLKIKERFNKATMQGKLGSGTETDIKLVSQNASVYLNKQ